MKKVFLVHGRDDSAVKALKALFAELRLESIDFERDAKPEARRRSGGQPSVLEIVEAAIDMSDVTVVLFTGDEHAALRAHLNEGKIGQFEPKARHNVAFEAGLAMALPKGQQRTILMSIGNVVVHSDLGGKHFLRVNSKDQPSDWRDRVRVELESVLGCPLTPSAGWLNVGNLSKTLAAYEPPGLQQLSLEKEAVTDELARLQSRIDELDVQKAGLLKINDEHKKSLNEAAERNEELAAELKLRPRSNNVEFVPNRRETFALSFCHQIDLVREGGVYKSPFSLMEVKAKDLAEASGLPTVGLGSLRLNSVDARVLLGELEARGLIAFSVASRRKELTLAGAKALKRGQRRELEIQILHRIESIGTGSDGDEEIFRFNEHGLRAVSEKLGVEHRLVRDVFSGLTDRNLAEGTEKTPSVTAAGRKYLDKARD